MGRRRKEGCKRRRSQVDAGISVILNDVFEAVPAGLTERELDGLALATHGLRHSCVLGPCPGFATEID